MADFIFQNMAYRATVYRTGIVTFALCITYTYWTLDDAWVKKDKHLENKKMSFWVHVTFFIL